MDDHSIERLASIAGIGAALALGAPALWAAFTGNVLIDGPAAAWWACYLLFLGVFWIDARGHTARPSWLTEGRLVAVEVVLAAPIYLMSVRYGWSGILFVITAAGAAFIWPIRAVAALVAGQSAIIGIGLALADESVEGTVITMFAYGTFQAFAVVMVFMSRREAAARADLASAHAQLRASSALLAESSRTAERLRIARDLHDTVGHQLTGLSLELEVASHHADGAALDHVRRARTISKDLLSSVRAAVDQLREPYDGLSTPLRAVVDGIAKPEVTLRVIEEATIDEERAQAVVRCVQEIVTNTLRHANAQHLSITVAVTDENVQVRAHDDGDGVADLRPGNGLSGMRERLAQLGGHIQLETAAGKGFRVNAQVPTA